MLLVLQARDAAGKDGTVRSIFCGLNPAGIQVTSFKVPAGREAEQDYLWRVHKRVPGRRRDRRLQPQPLRRRVGGAGEGLVPESAWRKRYRHINEFERLLTDEGTPIVKCFFNVSKQEQAQRFQDRLDDPAKGWKFREGDLDDRKLWPKFREAYKDAITRTSTSYAPWYVVPADHNWVRNLAVAKILLKTLQDLDPEVPRARTRHQTDQGRVVSAMSVLISTTLAEALAALAADPSALVLAGGNRPDGRDQRGHRRPESR